MLLTNRRKSQQLSVRLSASDIAMIDRAADRQGSSRTDFVRNAALRAAEEALLPNSVIRMSPAGFDAFYATTGEPGQPVPEIVEALRRRAPWGVARDSDKPSGA